jgi:hypothetical protein
MAEAFPYPPEIETIVSTFANPRYSTSANTYPINIDCTVSGSAAIWNATPNGVMPYDVDIYNRIVAQEWGPVAAYVAPVVPPPTQTELLAYANTVNNNYRIKSRSYDLTGATVNSDVISATLAEVNGLALWGNSNASSTVQWVDNAGVVTVITGTQCVSLQSQLIPYNSSLYDVLAQASTGISGGTITTYAEIDALSWPT